MALPKQDEKDTDSSCGNQGTTPSLISPDALLYYPSMDAAVLIPIAFLVAGSVAIILTVYMVR
jgi:hypothetical protein